jgi:hypothetical protein
MERLDQTVDQLDSDKLHVYQRRGANPPDLSVPRRYTLTHSDLTGELFLTIGTEYDINRIYHIYTRLMRDEVLACWKEDEGGPILHVYCHVSGGLIVGTAKWRYGIFQYHLPMVLQAFRYGDQPLFETHPDLDQAPVQVHFHAREAKYNRIEDWGTLAHYVIRSTNR